MNYLNKRQIRLGVQRRSGLPRAGRLHKKCHPDTCQIPVLDVCAPWQRLTPSYGYSPRCGGRSAKQGGHPRSQQVDELLDERLNSHRGETSSTRHPTFPRVAGRLLGSASRGRFWIFTTGWSVQPLPQPKKLIDHNPDSQQHQQRHGDGGTHLLIIPAQAGIALVGVLGELVQTTTGR